MKKISIILACLAVALILAMPLYGHAQCDDLITNGDFEGGNADFATDYNYVSPESNSLTAPGTYTIATDPSDVHNNWFSYGDHPSGSGNMLIVNAACNEGDGSGCDSTVKVIWEQAVTVSPNTEYVLTYYLSSSYSDNPANISTSINGTEIGQQTALASTGNWTQVSYSWNSGDSSSATIIFKDLTRQYQGDDFAIDDISLCLAGNVYGLCAGQTMDVGHVQVWNDETNIYVTYLITEPGACLSETHLHVAGPVEVIPRTKKYNPIPGQFDHMREHSCVNSYTYTVPNDWVSSDELQIAAHAVVQMPSSSSAAACADGNIDFYQGPMNNNAAVPTRTFSTCDSECRANPANAYGVPDGEVNYHDRFFSLGFGGNLILTFPSFVSGELKVYETSWGDLPLETADVSVSRNGSDWTSLGTAYSDSDDPVNPASYPTTFQLNECVQYVKIVDTTDAELFTSFLADGFDVDAVCASSTCDEETAWGGCFDKGQPFAGSNWATYFTYMVQ